MSDVGVPPRDPGPARTAADTGLLDLTLSIPDLARDMVGSVRVRAAEDEPGLDLREHRLTHVATVKALDLRNVLDPEDRGHVVLTGERDESLDGGKRRERGELVEHDKGAPGVVSSEEPRNERVQPQGGEEISDVLA